jgi:gas vesicle protein GvpL/GvpF
MKSLLHCVFRYDGTDAPEECGPEVAVVQQDGMAVAASPWSGGEGPIEVDRLLAYERAIAVLHATRTVVPLRFGCIMDGSAQILRLLEERGAEFEELLGRLEGLTEMGVRVWWKSPAEERFGQAKACPTPGARYLAAARRRQAGLLSPLEEQWAQRICGSLEGSYVLQKREARPLPEGRLLSLHFLTARGAVGDFRERVRRMALPGEAKLLVSGPWPPYNFAGHA